MHHWEDRESLYQKNRRYKFIFPFYGDTSSILIKQWVFIFMRVHSSNLCCAKMINQRIIKSTTVIKWQISSLAVKNFRYWRGNINFNFEFIKHYIGYIFHSLLNFYWLPLIKFGPFTHVIKYRQILWWRGYMCRERLIQFEWKISSRTNYSFQIHV